MPGSLLSWPWVGIWQTTSPAAPDKDLRGPETCWHSTPATLQREQVLQADTTSPPSRQLRKHVVIFEVQGGHDKGTDGHRPETACLLAAFSRLGWTAEVLFYTDDRWQHLQHLVSASADAFISRINPGAYPNFTESLYLDLCRSLHAAGLAAFPHPDAMLAYGAKAALYHLRDTCLGLPDTFLYSGVDSFTEGFRHSLALSDRVIKPNRGSAGEGVWVVRPQCWRRGIEQVPITDDAMLSCTDMHDNHVEICRFADFVAARAGSLQGAGDSLVDQRFLPRIVEGEVRVLMVGATPVRVVHKQPLSGNLSATLFSGARYTYDQADDPKWASLMRQWHDVMPSIRDTLGGFDYPLLWAADLILDTADGSDAYRLGEFNCSCVGFSTELGIATDIAEAAVQILEAK